MGKIFTAKDAKNAKLDQHNFTQRRRDAETQRSRQNLEKTAKF